jgi:molecular chaperone GrpE
MRVDRDKAEMISFLSGKILSPLLTQVDNLERAVKLKEGVEGDSFVDGVRSMLISMEKYLESQGVSVFVSLGQEVDPAKHDVMTQAPGEEGKIITEFEKGYMIGSRVLRHAKVVVGSGV